MKKNRKKVSYVNANSMDSRWNIDAIIHWTLLFTLTILPLLFRPVSTFFDSPFVNSGVENTGHLTEFYAVFKFRFLLIMSIMLLTELLFKLLIKKSQFFNSKIQYFIYFIFLGLTLSTLFSDYTSISFYGHRSFMLGLVSYFCFFILFFCIINVSITQKRIWHYVYCLIPYTLVNTLVMVSSFFGNDNVLKNLFFVKNNIQFMTPVVPVDVNVNIASGFLAITFSLFFASSLLKKTLKEKVLFTTMSLISFIGIIISLSKSGFYTIVLMSIFTIIVVTFINYQVIKKNILNITFLLICSISVLLIFSSHSSEVWENTLGDFFKNPFHTKNLNNTQNEVTKTPKDTLVGDLNETPKVNDYKNNELRLGGLASEINQKTDGDYLLPVLPSLQTGALSGRVYIWRKAIESWSQNPLFGNGLDTYYYKFDHTNIETGKYLASYETLINGTHNTYLSWLFCGGLVTLIGIVSLIFVTLIKWFRYLLKRTLSYSLLVIGCGLLAFLIQGIVNDGTIPVLAFFWVFLGIIINQLYSKSST